MKSRITPYWPLIKSLLLPLGIMKFLLISIPVVFFSVLVIVWFNKGPETALRAVLPILLSMVTLYFFIVGIILPHQALTIISSKSLGYLTDFRKFYLSVALVFSLLFVLMAAISIIYQQSVIDWYKVVRSGIQVWLVASGYVISLFILTYKFPLLQGVVFFSFVAIGQVFNALNQWHLVQLLGTLSLLWLVFALWWLRLKPQKHHVNIMAQSMEQMMLQTPANSAGVWLTNFLTPASKPASFLGTRLMGSPDSTAAIIRMWLMIIVVMFLMAILLKWLMGNNFKSFMENTGIFFVVFMIISSVSGVMVAICRTIKSLWTFFPGSRTQMFQFIEKYALTFSIKAAMVIPMVVLMLNQVVGYTLINFSQFLWLTLIVILISFLTFYSVIFVYSRDDDNKLPVSPLHGVIVFGSSMLVVVLNIFLLNEFHKFVSLTLIFIFLIVLLMRTKLVKKWQHINFVRVS